MSNVCPQCGAPLDPGATECKYCGEKMATQQAAQQTNNQQPQGYGPQPQIIINQNAAAPQYPVYPNGIDPNWPLKNKVVAGLLGIFLGGLGIHKFYMGKIGMGILYILFCWTFIPEVVGLIEGIVYLCTDDIKFQQKYHVRLG